jgi:hypothetical protein
VFFTPTAFALLLEERKERRKKEKRKKEERERTKKEERVTGFRGLREHRAPLPR